MIHLEIRRLFFAAALCGFGAFGTASAGPITYTTIYNAGNQFITATPICLPLPGCNGVNSVSWTFNILNSGYNPAVQDIVSATIALSLRDDGGLLDSFEYASLSSGSNSFSFQVATGVNSMALNSLLILSGTGMLSVTLVATGGDFYFNSATLTANAADKVITPAGPGTPTGPSPTAPISEPATLSLLGIALLGLAMIQRRRTRSV